MLLASQAAGRRTLAGLFVEALQLIPGRGVAAIESGVS